MKTNLTLKQITEKLTELTKKGHDAYSEAGADMDFSKVRVFGKTSSAENVEAMKALNKELSDLGSDRDELTALKRDEELLSKSYQPGSEPQKKGDQRKSAGELFVESKAFKQHGIEDRVDIDVKTLFQTTAGWDPDTVRQPGYVESALRTLRVIDFIPQLTTNRDTIKYMKETTFTNNAAEKAAGNTYGEAALALTETSDEVEKVTIWLPATDEQLEDVPGVAQYINNRLTYMLRARLESQVLEGNGSTPNLWGAKSLSSVLTQAKGTDPTPDAIYKAFTQIRVTGFAEPSVLFVHPNDWQDIRLLRTADGIYIMGSPTEPGPFRIWGVPVVDTTACAENTGITGDWAQFSTLFMRRGITFKVSDSHDTYFINGKQAVRADLRCAMVYFRDNAFCKITGI